MDVHVPEARDKELPSTVHNVRSRWRSRIGSLPDTNDAVPFNIDGHIRVDATGNDVDETDT